MKQTRSLKNQIFALMALLVTLQSIALVLALFFSQVFLALDAEAFRLFNTATETRANDFNRGMGELVGNMAGEARRLSGRIEELANEAGQNVQNIYMDDILFEEAAAIGAEAVVNILQTNSVTGAFVIFEGSNARKADSLAHSAVYIRDPAPDNTSSTNQSFQIAVGPSSLSTRLQIALSINWRLDMWIEEDAPFYYMPIWASQEFPRSEMERYGYWSTPTDPLLDNQQVICYTMPLLDRRGNSIGVIGMELSQAHLTRNYLPNTDLPYENSFFSVVQVVDDNILLDWFIPSGPVAQLYLSESGMLTLSNTTGVMTQTHIDGLGDMYCSLRQLRIYSENSPFFDQSWTLVAFVSTDVLHETSNSVRTTLMGSILVTTALAFVAVFLLTWFATREISQLPQYIRSFAPYNEIHFKRTGLREIDELTTAIEVLNRSVMNSSKITSKIMELTAMPMGGFEVPVGAEFVILTGFIYDLLSLPADTPVTVMQWRDIHARLVAQPAAEYENVYRFDGEQAETSRWLRIQQAETDGGTVGTIVDVTEEVERSLSLERELDYDALTHLYSRTAFKRRVHELIERQPDCVGAMIFADLDNLKFINDTYGHDVGDRFLIQAGQMFGRFAEQGGVVSRISGDEFAVYLHGYASEEEVLADIQKQFAHFRDSTMTTPDGSRQRIRSSAGVALYPGDSDNVTDLLKLSDFAMYEAKNNNKGTLFQFSKQSYKQNAYLLDNREAINRLLDEGLIRFALQPIVSLKTAEVYGYEALMRPLLDDFSSPLEILTVAAAQSKLNQLERLVMMTAFQFAHENRMMLRGKKLFINSISSQQLSEEDMQFLSRRYQSIVGSIVIEVTEEQNASQDMLKNKMNLLKQMGLQLAIDDFGAGYSNELRVLSLNPHIIKIDMGIIQGIHESPDKQQLVANILNFCIPRGIRVIAEGVEQQEELVVLYALGVDYVQGYLIGKPDFKTRAISRSVVNLIETLNSDRMRGK